MQNRYLLKFLRKKQIAKNTWSFYFSRDKYPDFFSGQYNIVTIFNTDKTEPNISHEFTISSSPTEKEFIMITTKIEKRLSKFKEILSNLKPNSEIQFEGPKGGFYLRVEDSTPRVLIAGGIGLTPFYSMINFAHEKKLAIPLTLLASSPSVEEMIYYKELSSIAEKNNFIKINYTITSLKEDRESYIDNQSVRFERGRISDKLIKKYVSNIYNSIFMLAGPPKMLDDLTRMLNRIGVKEENIKVDLFTGY